ncbi:hypothetical protein ACFL03_01180 [Thermodesulfobacteriota bacterium]
MEIREKEPFWRNFKIYQVWRFTVLNFKILQGVIHSKRLFKFVIKYKVSYVVKGNGYPPTIVNTAKPPQTGDRVQLGRNKFEVIEVLQLMPPRGEFCFLQASCKLVDDS